MNMVRAAGWFLAHVVWAIVLLVISPVWGADNEALERQFVDQVLPILRERCFDCHSHAAGEASGGLILDSRTGWEVGGVSGPAIVPGTPSESLLLKAVRYEDPDLKMPPDERLSANELKYIEKWIEQGAVDPRASAIESVDHSASSSSDGVLWSLAPIVQPVVPGLRSIGWSRAEIDRFILAELQRKGLKPVDDAERLRLLRRLHFDLVGLPPTVSDITAFESRFKVDRARAVEEVVDRLLLSTHFGERWGRHWLDVARYAESNGMAWNMTLPHAWRYRDYVIRAFNSGKPFNRFLMEQLAGDLLPSQCEEERVEGIVATGFLALGPKTLYEKESEIPRERCEWVDEQINTVSKAMLGLTVGCARCHDHKFDPIPTRDYYALAGIFFNTQILSGPKVGKPAEWKKAGSVESESIPISSAQEIFQARQLQENISELGAQLDQLNKRKKAEEKSQVAGQEGSSSIPRADNAPSQNLLQEIESVQAQLDSLNKQANPLEYAFGVQDAQAMEPSFIRLRGLWNQLGDEVPRGFLSSLKMSDEIKIPEQASGRLQLAQWISHSQNPLTPRVAVNRMWHHLFGRGLVETVDNFGSSGALPSHPELLDYLADRFVHELDWSVKKLIREIVLSRTYQLSTAVDAADYQIDPENRLLWRSSPRRLDAEALRDSILMAGGLLDTSPVQGSAVSALKYTMLTPGLVEKIHGSSQRLHRSVYIAPLRGQDTDDFLIAFDFPDPGVVIGDRESTTVPSQSLVLMNSPLVEESARAMAVRLLSDGSSMDQVKLVELAHKIALGRLPSPAEIDRAQAALQQFPGNQLQRWTAYCQALMMSTEFRYLY